MTSVESSDRLRLAALALIEWRTPVTSREYQRILTGLLEAHPDAASWNLTPEKEILQLDERGSILWYLSETIDAVPSTLLEELQDDYEVDVARVCIRRLLHFGVLSENEENTRIWREGPTTSEVADRVLEAVLKEQDSQGYVALLAIAVPFERSVQLESFRQMMEYEQAPPNTLRRLSGIVNKSYWIWIVVQLLILGYYAYDFLSAGFDLRTLSWTAWMSILVFSVVTLTLIYSFVRRAYFQRRISDVVVRSSVVHEKRYTRDDLHTWGVQLLNALGIMCASNAKIFHSLLKRDQEDPDGLRWGELALAATEYATPDVVREVLELFRHPELDEPMRARIFHWLCTVHIVDRHNPPGE